MPGFGLPLDTVADALTAECGPSVKGQALWRLPDGVEVTLESNDGIPIAGVRARADGQLIRASMDSRAALAGFLGTIRLARSLARTDPAAAMKQVQG
jgi:hypothetical protein